MEQAKAPYFSLDSHDPSGRAEFETPPRRKHLLLKLGREAIEMAIPYFGRKKAAKKTRRGFRPYDKQERQEIVSKFGPGADADLESLQKNTGIRVTITRSRRAS